MILNETIPEKSLYILGAKIIDVLRYYDEGVLLDELYSRVSDHMEIEYFILSLDWLYLLGILDRKDGMISKCF